MARARNIKPGFFMNDRLAEIEPLGRLLFAGLWTIADREGRLEDRPKKIKAEVLPYDDCDVAALLNALRDGGFILRYEVEGQRYIQISNFTKHQNPHIKEPASILPAPDLHQTSTVQEPCKTGSSPADSLNLIPDSLNLIPSNDEIEYKEAAETKPRPPFKSLKQEHLFDLFWDKYPRKKSKGQAEKTWDKINPDDLLFKRIMDGLDRGRASPDWLRDNGKYIPHPSTWLNAKGWLDEFNPQGDGGGNDGDGPRIIPYRG